MTTGQVLAAMKRIKVTVMNMAVMPQTLGENLMLVLHAQCLYIYHFVISNSIAIRVFHVD